MNVPVNLNDPTVLTPLGAGRRNPHAGNAGIQGLLQAQDSVLFGGQGVSNDQSMNIVLERAMEKLRAVVGDARAELGIPEGAVIDTSPEATAERILEFALGNFDRYHENHEELGDDEARQEFADFIGAAIHQGISEASDILSALDALNPDNESMIGTISGIVDERLAAFAAGGTDPV